MSKDAKVKEKKIKTKKAVEENYSKKFSVLEMVILISFTALIFMFVGAFVFYKKYQDGKFTFSRNNNLKDIQTVYDSLIKDSNNKIDSSSIIESALRGIGENIGDNYTYYIPKNEVPFNNERLDGEFIGLGITVSNNDKNAMTVLKVIESSPAEKSGILVGDLIYKVDDISLDTYSISNAITYIKNLKKGNVVKVYILRDNKEIELDIRVDLIENELVTAFEIEKNDKKIGVIKISYFSKNTASQFKKAYKKLDVDYLIIDLRDNGGGYLSNASNIAGMFLEQDTIIYKIKTKDNVEEIKNQFDKEIDLKTLLLVNENTASSSEMFVAALKENLNSKVVGVRTYGKGYVQKVLELENGGLFKFSAREILTPKGNIIEEKGIAVDKEIELNETSLPDVQLETAINEILR